MPRWGCRPRLPRAGTFPILGNSTGRTYAAATANPRRHAMQKSPYTENYQRLLEALRQARKNAGLTQLDVAERLGTYASYVSKCESGERRIDVVELAEFCQLYGVALAEFLKSAGLS